jgi:HK97 family phage prohead protease
MKNLQFHCEAQVSLSQSTDESQTSRGNIEARVTTWGAREGADGRRFNYQPEGFADWATNFAEEGKPLPMFLNHNDMGMPVGQWDEFVFDDEGMTAKGKLFRETTGGSDIYHVLKESPRLFGGVSVGAFAEEAQMVDADGNPSQEEDAFFQITKGGLREVSVVMYPNNPAAEVMKLECFEAGLSKKNATTASSIFKKMLEKRDVAPATIEESPKQSDSDAVVKETEAILKALEHRELMKSLNKRIK